MEINIHVTVENLQFQKHIFEQFAKYAKGEDLPLLCTFEGYKAFTTYAMDSASRSHYRLALCACHDCLLLAILLAILAEYEYEKCHHMNN